MEDADHLFGSCACERNQYTIRIPRASSSLAHVYFDNSAANRRSQAAPLTAWLRIPLDWFHSTTYALFPDETHPAIRRTYYHPAARASLPPTRRQFCGFCGTHLTAWNEGWSAPPAAVEVLDVTLGSLGSESLDLLEELVGPLSEEQQQGEEGDGAEGNTSREVRGAGRSDAAAEGLIKGGSVDDEDHIPSDEGKPGGVVGEDAPPPPAIAQRVAPQRILHQMRHRGIPFFEEMVENSPLGRIRRQRGGTTSLDGTMSEEWEIVEIDGIGEGGDSENTIMVDAAPNKRLKTGR